jgi:cytochrome c oxidase assembly factor CtaG
MSPTSQAILGAWSIGLWPALGLALSALIYLRGWRVLTRVNPERFPGWRAGAFLTGLMTLAVAVASPLDALSGFLLSAHMVQHLLLMSVAAPLLLLGAPLLPLLRGLPRAWAHDGLGPFLSSPGLRRWGHRLTHPVIGWLALLGGLCFWHVPAAFELALRSPGWHEVEHATFFLGSLLFWWPVIRPFPSRPVWPLWTVPLYLLAADLVNSALCAILAFSERVLYPTYAAAPRLFGTSALSDQASAGVIMWVPGSIAFLIPATGVAIQFLSSGQRLMQPIRPGSPPPVRPPPPRPSRRFDLLAVPVLGRLLRAAIFRRIAQGSMLVLALAVIIDGFRGPVSASANLAGVLPWTFARSLAVVALLAAGNAFCFACPFLLPRTLVRRLGLARHEWPRWLRTKWLAVALLGAFFWAYEVFDLWNRPQATALLVMAYFVIVIAVDALFRGASFCKYVCPIGQFNFVTSLVSPLEVQVRSPDVCATCRTHDCLRGNATQQGCELELYLPRKAGSLDCTFCLDCVRACPHDNIGLLAVAPAAELRRDPVRSSLGRLSQRRDIAALALVIVFSAFTGAAAMTAPVTEWITAAGIGARPWSRPLVVTLLFAITTVLLPLLGLGLAAGAGRRWSGAPVSVRDLSCRLALALIPLGAAMWAAHLVFHLLTAASALGPVWQRVVPGGLNLGRGLDLSLRPETVLSLQTLLLGGGLLLSLHTGWRVACDWVPGSGRPLRMLLHWALLATLLYGFGLWTLLQPMPLRGLMEIPLSR